MTRRFSFFFSIDILRVTFVSISFFSSCSSRLFFLAWMFLAFRDFFWELEGFEVDLDIDL